MMVITTITVLIIMIIMSMACNLYWPLGRSGTVQARSLQYGRTGTDLVSVKSDLVLDKSDIVGIVSHIILVCVYIHLFPLVLVVYET